MTDQTMLAFLLAYSVTALCVAFAALVNSSGRLLAIGLIVLSAFAIAGVTLLGNALAETNFAKLLVVELMRFSRTFVAAVLLGVSCALPLAAAFTGDSKRRSFRALVVTAGVLGTLAFGTLTAARELISPYLPIPDTALDTGAFGRLVPPEFVLEEFRDTNIIPVRVAVSPQGRVYVSGHSGIAAQEGVVVELIENDDGEVTENIVARMLNRPYGLLATDDALYVSRSGQHAKWSDGRVDQVSTGAITELRDLDGDGVMDYYDDVVSDLPGAKGPDYLHQNNGIALGKDGALYITTANHADGHPVPDRRAGAILRASGPGFERVELFASGLRNPFGLAFGEDGELYATDNDAQTGNLGGNLGDKLLKVDEGDFFGHPYAPDDSPEVAPPLLRSAYALGGIVTAASDRLPAPYRGQMFVVVYGEGRIMHVVSNVSGDVRLEPFATVPGAVDIAASPNGDFYVGVYPDKVMRLRLVAPRLVAVKAATSGFPPMGALRPLALVLLASTGAAAAAAVAALAGSMAGVFSEADRVSLERGASVFAERCSSCHAVVPDSAAGFGPNLSRIGEEAGGRRPGLDSTEYILESIAMPDAHREPGMEGHMPSGTLDGVGERGVRDLVGYLMELSGERDARRIDNLVIDRAALAGEPRYFADLATLRRGEMLFTEKLGCAACHSILGEPGSDLYAPSLVQAGLLSSDYLRQSLREPSAVIAGGYRMVSVTTNGGQVVRGRLLKEDAQHLEILSLEGSGAPRLHRLQKLEVLETVFEPDSRMPGYAELSRKEEDALIAFLRSLTASIGGH